MFVVFSLLVGCFTSDVPNPSGECEADSDGSRLCYHSPNATDTYLLDCKNPRDRELWRVFAQTEESAYVIPRPDVVGIYFGLCEEGTVHAELFAQYKLCDEMLDSEGIEIINNLPPAAALAITNILHQNLRFEELDGAIFPFSPEDDMLAACALMDDSLVDDYCAMLENNQASKECLDIDYNLPEGSVPLFVDALNQIYGIE